MEKFDSIRPYRDDEVPDVTARLLRDQEFLSLVSGYKLPRLSRVAPRSSRWLVRRWATHKYGTLTSIDAVQRQLAGFVEQLVTSSTASVTNSGLDALDPDKPYLFLSNHRDIVFDPMIVNYLLYLNGMQTARIAIGDNLLQNRVFAELMRLNKSFLVRRNLTSAREMRDAFMTLSAFINHCIDDRHNVWIAQREGRAKSGIDQTDPAIIKMLYMSRKKDGVPFDEAMNRLNIVPVSISYELDPCDSAKARELEIRDRTGEYTKGPDEDTHQIMQGLAEFKGRVHVHFGKPVSDAPDQPVRLAQCIDREIIGHYRLHPSNWAAWSLLNDVTDIEQLPIPAPDMDAASLSMAREQMQNRIREHDPVLHPYLLSIYANPVVQAISVEQGQL